MIKIDLGGKLIGLRWQHPFKSMPISKDRERKLWNEKMAAIKDSIYNAVRRKDFELAAALATLPPMKKVRFTFCEIFEITQAATKPTEKDKIRSLASATTLCSLKDNFSKESGRKTSLARAMREAGFDVKERTLVNLAYLTRPRPKSKQTELAKLAEQDMAAGETIH